MSVNILIVDQKPDDGMGFLGLLAASVDLDVEFEPDVVRAIKKVKREDYDFIIMGDRVSSGDLYDVGLAIKAGQKNNHIPVVCVGAHRGRTTRLVNLLRPYALRAEKDRRQVVADKLVTYLLERRGGAGTS